ncbi:hypothetical protein [Rhodobacter sp. NSM]
MSDATTSRPSLHGEDRPSASEDAHAIMINRVSWGAIFAGVVLALVV